MARVYFKQQGRWQAEDVALYAHYMDRAEIREIRNLLIPLKVKFAFVRSDKGWYKIRLQYTSSGVIDTFNFIDMFIAPLDLRLFLTLSE